MLATIGQKQYVCVHSTKVKNRTTQPISTPHHDRSTHLHNSRIHRNVSGRGCLCSTLGCTRDLAAFNHNVQRTITCSNSTVVQQISTTLTEHTQHKHSPPPHIRDCRGLQCLYSTYTKHPHNVHNSAPHNAASPQRSMDLQQDMGNRTEQPISLYSTSSKSSKSSTHIYHIRIV